MRRPIASDMRRDSLSATVQRRIVLGACPHCRRVQVAEIGRQGRQRRSRGRVLCESSLLGRLLLKLLVLTFGVGVVDEAHVLVQSWMMMMFLRDE